MNHKEKKVANKVITLRDWCTKNGYKGVTKQCVLSAFQSKDPKIQAMAKREKLKGVAHGD